MVNKFDLHYSYKPMTLIRGHSLVYLLSTFNALLGWSAYLFFCLSARPFLGLFREVDSPPGKFLLDLWRIWHLPINIFCCLTSCAVQHLGILGKYCGFLSVLEGSTDCVLTIVSGGRSKGGGVLVCTFRASWT